MKNLLLLPILLLLLTACSSTKKKSVENKRAQLFYDQGTNNLYNKDYTEALKNLLEAYKYSPNDTKILNNLGMAYYFKKSVNNAKSFLKRSLEVDPKNSDARMNYASILVEEKKYSDAKVQYDRILKNLIYSKQFKTFHNLAKIELKQNNTAKAISYLKESIKSNENYCPAFFQLGKIQFERGQYKKAERNFKEAGMGLCYKLPEPRFFRAKALVKMNQYFEAAQILEEMTETFAMTKWETIARRGLNKVKGIHNKKTLDTLEAKNTGKTITSPDF